MSRSPALTPEHFTTFGELLKFLRRRAGFSQRELSIAVGYSESQISRLEQNQRPPDAAAVAARFVPALNLESERDWVARLLALAAVSKASSEPNQPGSPVAFAVHNLPLQLTSFIGRAHELDEITRLFTPGSQAHTVRLLAEDSPSATPQRGRRGVGGPPAADLADASGVRPGAQAVRLLAEDSPSATPQRGRREAVRLLAEDSPSATPQRGRREAVRLLTLTGPGGTGKTRLALQCAVKLLASFPDGVWLIDLAPLAEPTLVPQAVARVLRLREEVGRPLLDTLSDHLRALQVLLVLDNCEHLIEASAQLSDVLLHACPWLRILATSREFLGIPGEHVFYVPSLSTPDTGSIPPLERLGQYDAVRLFVERAQAGMPGFALSSANATAVTQICQRLDGIPLAIELAAARLRILPVQQIAARLDDRFHLLTGGSRTALPRHQTLQALIDWSYELLPEAERVLLNRLAVFAGGWTLEAAQEITKDDDGGITKDEGGRRKAALLHPSSFIPVRPALDGVHPSAVLDLLSHLIDKSLVLAEDRSGTARYRMLETIRQYAFAKLVAGGELDIVRRRHAAYYAAIAEIGRGTAAFSIPSDSLKRLSEERDNLRAALPWSLSANGSAEIGLRLATAAFGSLGYWNEGRTWLQSALAHPDALSYPHARAHALHRLGHLLSLQGEYAAGQTRMEESLTILQELGDLTTSAWVLNRLGWLARERGDVVGARLRLEESLALCRELGDAAGIAEGSITLAEVAVMEEDAAGASALLEVARTFLEMQKHKYRVGWMLNHLGHVAQLRGDYRQATSLHEESLALFREHAVPNIGIAENLQSLGESALAEGRAAVAAEHLTDALEMFRHLGGRAGIAWSLAGLAGAAALEGDLERAARLWGSAEALRQAMGARHAPASRATRERLMSAVRTQLGDAAFDAAWAKGQAALPEQVIADSLRGAA